MFVVSWSRCEWNGCPRFFGEWFVGYDVGDVASGQVGTTGRAARTHCEREFYFGASDGCDGVERCLKQGVFFVEFSTGEAKLQGEAELQIKIEHFAATFVSGVDQIHCGL